jgi:hypothetical protein
MAKNATTTIPAMAKTAVITLISPSTFAALEWLVAAAVPDDPVTVDWTELGPPLPLPLALALALAFVDVPLRRLERGGSVTGGLAASQIACAAN